MIAYEDGELKIVKTVLEQVNTFFVRRDRLEILLLLLTEFNGISFYSP